MHAKASSWSTLLSLIHVKATDCLYAHTLCRCTHELHHTLAPYPSLHTLARTMTTPCLKSTPLPIATMTPCCVPSSLGGCFYDTVSLLSSLGAVISHGIVLVTLHPGTRHYILVLSILRHVLSWLHCCCISMLHPSNKLWCCTHGSSSYLTQVIVPLCLLRGKSALCLVRLQPRVAHHYMSWSPCVTANKAGPMCLARFICLAPRSFSVATPMLPCLTLSHLPLLKEHFDPF